MLVDCFLSLWFHGLINLGEYSEGKATRNRALAVYKSGALRSVNNAIGFEQLNVLLHIQNNGKDEQITSFDLVIESRSVAKGLCGEL